MGAKKKYNLPELSGELEQITNLNNISKNNITINEDNSKTLDLTENANIEERFGRIPDDMELLQNKTNNDFEEDLSHEFLDDTVHYVAEEDDESIENRKKSEKAKLNIELSNAISALNEQKILLRHKGINVFYNSVEPDVIKYYDNVRDVFFNNSMYNERIQTELNTSKRRYRRELFEKEFERFDVISKDDFLYLFLYVLIEENDDQYELFSFLSELLLDSISINGTLPVNLFRKQVEYSTYGKLDVMFALITLLKKTPNSRLREDITVFINKLVFGYYFESNSKSKEDLVNDLLYNFNDYEKNNGEQSNCYGVLIDTHSAKLERVSQHIFENLDVFPNIDINYEHQEQELRIRPISYFYNDKSYEKFSALINYTSENNTHFLDIKYDYKISNTNKHSKKRFCDYVVESDSTDHIEYKKTLLKSRYVHSVDWSHTLYSLVEQIGVYDTVDPDDLISSKIENVFLKIKSFGQKAEQDNKKQKKSHITDELLAKNTKDMYDCISPLRDSKQDNTKKDIILTLAIKKYVSFIDKKGNPLLDTLKLLIEELIEKITSEEINELFEHSDIVFKNDDNNPLLEFIIEKNSGYENDTEKTKVIADITLFSALFSKLELLNDTNKMKLVRFFNDNEFLSLLLIKDTQRYEELYKECLSLGAKIDYVKKTPEQKDRTPAKIALQVQIDYNQKEKLSTSTEKSKNSIDKSTYFIEKVLSKKPKLSITMDDMKINLYSLLLITAFQSKQNILIQRLLKIDKYATYLNETIADGTPILFLLQDSVSVDTINEYHKIIKNTDINLDCYDKNGNSLLFKACSIKNSTRRSAIIKTLVSLSNGKKSKRIILDNNSLLNLCSFAMVDIENFDLLLDTFLYKESQKDEETINFFRLLKPKLSSSNISLEESQNYKRFLSAFIKYKVDDVNVEDIINYCVNENDFISFFALFAVERSDEFSTTKRIKHYRNKNHLTSIAINAFNNSKIDIDGISSYLKTIKTYNIDLCSGDKKNQDEFNRCIKTLIDTYTFESDNRIDIINSISIVYRNTQKIKESMSLDKLFNINDEELGNHISVIDYILYKQEKNKDTNYRSLLNYFVKEIEETHKYDIDFFNKILKFNPEFGYVTIIRSIIDKDMDKDNYKYIVDTTYSIMRTMKDLYDERNLLLNTNTEDIKEINSLIYQYNKLIDTIIKKSANEEKVILNYKELSNLAIKAFEHDLPSVLSIILQRINYVAPPHFLSIDETLYKSKDTLSKEMFYVLNTYTDFDNSKEGFLLSPLNPMILINHIKPAFENGFIAFNDTDTNNIFLSKEIILTYILNNLEETSEVYWTHIINILELNYELITHPISGYFINYSRYPKLSRKEYSDEYLLMIFNLFSKIPINKLETLTNLIASLIERGKSNTLASIKDIKRRNNHDLISALRYFDIAGEKEELKEYKDKRKEFFTNYQVEGFNNAKHNVIPNKPEPKAATNNILPEFGHVEEKKVRFAKEIIVSEEDFLSSVSTKNEEKDTEETQLSKKELKKAQKLEKESARKAQKEARLAEKTAAKEAKKEKRESNDDDKQVEVETKESKKPESSGFKFKKEDSIFK